MKETYYTLENGNLKKVGSVIKTSRGWVSNPVDEDYAAMVDANGKPNPAYPRSEESFAPPAVDEGYHAVPDGYELVEELGVGSDGVDSPTPSLTHSLTKKWVRKWKVEPIQYTYDDYNRALEDYIHSVRVDRGYDEREPSPYYDNSIVPRWRADAADFNEFRDRCMLYGLPVLNKYKNNEEVPTLAEFKAGFPKMVWTYQEEV